DKRRRNTAASARFRVKKKIREQFLQKTLDEKTESAEKLQNRIVALEREIKWLKDLIM
ncbi:basic-leucine zipper transcription factor, partial [Phycomyces blakesleeanus NRRL 1555(-)]